ncbi:MAG: 6-hydroxymethylpterin diphosphokinase MptE-like protein [Candidatus Thorarchaeota archaeon]
MEWSEWQPIYLDIVQRLDLDTSKDREATALLTRILEDTDPKILLDQLRGLIDGKSVVVCGAGPSLEQHVKQLKAENTNENHVIVAADGAVSVLIEQDIVCDVVATDLDGNLEHLMEMTRRGAILIVHGHGDNIETMKSVVPELGEVLGSTQVEPTHRTFLWGGFTDGDRACHVVSEYKPKRIILAGMDFGRLVGQWSKPGHEGHFPASWRKRVKLEIAEELISSLFERTGIEHLFLDSTESG